MSSSKPRRRAAPEPAAALPSLAPALSLALLLGMLLALAAPAAQAALGERIAAIQGESLRMGAAVRQQLTAGARVHTLQLADGSTLRQYSGADGRVFAVAWNSRTKPRLDVLLGTYFGDYASAAREQQQRQPGARHAAVLRRGDLVVETTGHAQAFVGRAYLRSMLPLTQPAAEWR